MARLHDINGATGEAIERLESLRARLNKLHLRGVSWAELERIAGTGDGTLRRFAAGETVELSMLTLLRLSEAETSGRLAA